MGVLGSERFSLSSKKRQTKHIYVDRSATHGSPRRPWQLPYLCEARMPRNVQGPYRKSRKRVQRTTVSPVVDSVTMRGRNSHERELYSYVEDYNPIDLDRYATDISLSGTHYQYTRQAAETRMCYRVSVYSGSVKRSPGCVTNRFAE